MNRTNPAPEWNEYIAAFREDVHQLIAWGYADTRHRLAEAKDEYEMTGLLANGMDTRISAPQTHDRFSRYTVHNERPTSPSGELGKDRPKLDIQIECCGRRPKPSFTFEAKRLRDDASSSARASMRQYLGDDGIRRYIMGRYVPESPEAAMLGCVQARDAEFWFTQVGDAFAVDASSGGAKFSLVEGLQFANVIPDFPDERVSVHARQSSIPIRIFHLFIDCRRVKSGTSEP